MDYRVHEQAYRGEALVARLAHTVITMCGAGAVGANLVDTLVRQGAQTITVVDNDRVEEHNKGTQPYTDDDLGARKVDALQALCFRATGVEIAARAQRLDAQTVQRLLRGSALVVDGFDNHASRAVVQQWCQRADVPCLHIGLAADYAEVIWNERYHVPPDVVGQDVCAYPLARPMMLMAIAVGAEIIMRYLDTGVQQNARMTLGDFMVTRF